VPLSFSEYQVLAMRTRSKTYTPGDKTSLLVSALGLCGEAGELAELLKKNIAQGHSLPDDNIVQELGDIMWYLAHACECFGYPMEVVAETNIKKLKARFPDGFSTERSVNREDSDSTMGGVTR
jgi:NTP pyrophosphatase (non-canonical NTP hydrolase)